MQPLWRYGKKALKLASDAFEFPGDADDRHLAVGDDEIVFRNSKASLASFSAFFRTAERLQFDRTAGHDGAAAGKRPGTPIELVGIAGDEYRPR